MAPENIHKFFTQQLSAEESDQIFRYLTDHPEVLNQYLNEEEWENAAAAPPLTGELKSRIWSRIDAQMANRATAGKTVRLRPWAVAAATFFLAAGLWWLYQEQKPPAAPATAFRSTQKRVENGGKDTLTLYTPDGSMVRLLPKSILVYADPFTTRNLHLEGEALFTVKKDPARPFSVTSGNIATTAIGTVFSVRTFRREPVITVHLFEGKVAVQVNVARRNQHLLATGQTLVYNKASKAVTIVSPNQKRKAKPPKKGAPAPLPKEKSLSENHWYMFNNQPLSEVLAELERLYAVEIVYNPKDVQGITFIATLDKSDTLENILQSIASLNDLQLSRSGRKYILHKKTTP